MTSCYEENARVFKALCDEKRLRILELLKGGEKCICNLYEPLGLPQSTLSYHMKILCESGIVDGRQERRWTYYRISEQGSMMAVELLKKLTSVTADTLSLEQSYSCAPSGVVSILV